MSEVPQHFQQSMMELLDSMKRGVITQTRKRPNGVPKSGRVVVVVTDIEGYCGESKHEMKNKSTQTFYLNNYQTGTCECI